MIIIIEKNKDKNNNNDDIDNYHNDYCCRCDNNRRKENGKESRRQNGTQNSPGKRSTGSKVRGIFKKENKGDQTIKENKTLRKSEMNRIGGSLRLR